MVISKNINFQFGLRPFILQAYSSSTSLIPLLAPIIFFFLIGPSSLLISSFIHLVSPVKSLSILVTLCSHHLLLKESRFCISIVYRLSFFLTWRQWRFKGGFFFVSFVACP
ncbi:hypothetical protein MANES_10G066950v8 [Manihot esculenta]|uniref:Uncharacterized protein n=1 Tax=Manihot esculenta TaxID=3983 RepID=A0ACB7H022_MANES|nr:hypothetical protein MANES_10G066950v8 [Manihot esculenta]